MKIYRLETPDGLGPYQSGAVNRHRRGVNHGEPEMERCPLPYDDIPKLWKRGFGPRWYERFGFLSMRDLNRWFGDCLKAMMTRDNIAVVVYRVPKYDVLKGKKQVLFSRGIVIKRMGWKEVSQCLRRLK